MLKNHARRAVTPVHKRTDGGAERQPAPLRLMTVRRPSEDCGDGRGEKDERHWPACRLPDPNGEVRAERCGDLPAEGDRHERDRDEGPDAQRHDERATVLPDRRSVSFDAVQTIHRAPHLAHHRGSRDNALQTLGDPRDVSVVPGNHDAYVPGALDRVCRAWSPWMSGDDARASSRQRAMMPWTRTISEMNAKERP